MGELAENSTAPDVLTPQETADLLRTNTASLADLRYRGGGPTYIKIGRLVRYRRRDLESFMDSQAHSRTDKLVSP